MLAFLRLSGSSHGDDPRDLAERLASSLSLFNPGQARLAEVQGSWLVDCPVRRPPPVHRARSPRMPPFQKLALHPGPDGEIALLSGDIDNVEELEQALGRKVSSPAEAYALAWSRWGDDLDLHVIGDYASLLLMPDGESVRLARSPWRAPPLHYLHEPGRTLVTSVVRLFQVAGVAPRPDRRKLIDNLFGNQTEDRGFIEGTWRVGLAQRVLLRPGHEPDRRTYYNHLQPRTTPHASRAEHVAQVEHLLRQACAVALKDARTPGTFLSGGLDSSNVAVRALAVLPEERRLKSFTFRPHRDYSDIASEYDFSDDWPFVERLAGLHPRLEPYHARAEAFDDNWDQLFLAAGTAPAGLTNIAVFEPILREARKQGVDVMLDATLGNNTFSMGGYWAYVEYFLTGHWMQLYKALTRRPMPFWRLPMHFARWVLRPFMPYWLWRAWRRLRGTWTDSSNLEAAPLRPEVLEETDAVSRARASKVLYEMPFHKTRQDLLADAFGRGDCDGMDVLQGWEQIYGLRLRDVTAYRPLVEYCHGLPTGMFMHDGKDRWLARELGKGVLPEDQRLEMRQGFHNCDWHERIRDRLPEIARELEEAKGSPELGDVLDFERLDRTVSTFPARPSLDDSTFRTYAMGLLGAVMTVRYVRFLKGQNC